MKVITPTQITDSLFVSSSVAENDHPEWGAATAYTPGDLVIIAADHDRYEALTSHTNKPPATNPGDWLYLGKTNRWQMFDEKVGTVTTSVGSLTVKLNPGIVNAVALLNVTGPSAASVKVTDPIDGVVYDRTVALYDPTNVVDWWSYFFEEIRRKEFSLLLDLPTYRGGELEITLITTPEGQVSIGACVVGKLYQHGRSVQQGAAVGIQDYSRKNRDDFGNVEVVERAFNKRARWSLLIPNSEIDIFISRLAALRAVPAVYIGSELYASTIVYGFYRDFDVVVSYPLHSECSLELEGLV